MRKLFIFLGFAGLAAINACTDHEVIPPPVPLVDLNCECEATINDSTVSYTEDCSYSSEKVIVTGGLSKAQYKSYIEDEATVGGLELEVRSLAWSDDGSNNPTLEQWKTFFLDNPTPGYSDNVNHDGVEIRWTDPNGKVWVSDTSEAICLKNFVFQTLIPESDTTGDYMQFDAVFDCKLLNSDYGVDDSVKCLTDGHFRSAFKLE